MDAELHPAIWDGPYDAILPHQRVRLGDEAMVTEGDLLSEHWKAVKPVKRGKKGASTDTGTGDNTGEQSDGESTDKTGETA